MGKVLLGMETQSLLAEKIVRQAELEERTPKKVLVLDLDNTLWGGLAGETDHTQVLLSEDHSGLAYKNLQRVIKLMQEQGVLLAIASKNNEEDAMEILEHHPHMLLGPEDFAARRINWDPKPDNIRKMAEELNLGTDSFVFFDDSKAEREMVRQMLPEVTVPDFPARPEELAPCMAKIYEEYFARAVITKEDREKTAQYRANAGRNAMAEQAVSFEDYVKKLEICLIPVDPKEHLDRLTQLLNKTNQFNLTTRRYTREQMQQIVEDAGKRVFLYQVTDAFGDNGIVAAAIVDTAGELPEITDLVMSCRVMGRNIETSFTYHKGTGILEIDRTYCGVTKDVVCVRKIKIADPKGIKKMRFILDRQSIELFINDGHQVATTAVCTPLEAEGIRFFSDKKMYITVEKYDIVL